MRGSYAGLERYFDFKIGDAGLFAFRDADADPAVQSALTLQSVGDDWLAEQNYKGRVRTVMHVGPCAVGMMGGSGREVLDIMGKTVNIVGSMRTDTWRARGLIATRTLMRRPSTVSTSMSGRAESSPMPQRLSRTRKNP